MSPKYMCPSRTSTSSGSSARGFWKVAIISTWVSFLERVGRWSRTTRAEARVKSKRIRTAGQLRLEDLVCPRYMKWRFKMKPQRTLYLRAGTSRSKNGQRPLRQRQKRTTKLLKHGKRANLLTPTFYLKSLIPAPEIPPTSKALTKCKTSRKTHFSNVRTFINLSLLPRLSLWLRSARQCSKTPR